MEQKEQIIFYDTCALLHLQEKAFEHEFYISYLTLQELESIKTAKNKTEEAKYQARKITQLLLAHEGSYHVIVDTDAWDDCLVGTNDEEIIVTASNLTKQYDVIFVTDDMACALIARELFHLNVEFATVNKSYDVYKGYSIVEFDDEQLANFYNGDDYWPASLLTNEYMLIKHKDSIVDAYRWTGSELRKVQNKTIKSGMFGDKIRAKDVYQMCAIDSIINNTITAISGRAGSGKSLISLATIMYLIENGKYDRLVIMYNPTKTRGAADMGFYSGNATEKAMQNSIGSILTTKFGDRYAVDLLLQQDKLRLVSMADIRGMEVADNEILYITECQNTSIDLLKLCLQRASSKCKIVIEGDFNSQVDAREYEGNANGMKRAIEVLKGNEDFGCIELPNIWRSKIAALVDKF